MDPKQVFHEHTIDNTSKFSFSGIETVCRLVDIYDGDTVLVVFEYHGTFIQITVRLDGIDAPEIRSKDLLEKQQGFLARQKIIDLTCNGNLTVDTLTVDTLTVESSRADVQEHLKHEIVLVWLRCFDFEKYGRLLGSVSTYKNNEIGDDIGRALIDSGLAKVYQK
jgi:endonuclease YncB( thermonuclease family)